jgi:hypothetical protein
LAWWAGVAVLTLILTTTHQAGQLLYATVLPLAPDESRVDPEFGRLVRPLRDEIRIQRAGVPKKLQSLEQRLADLAENYLKAKGVRNPDGNFLCQKMAVEACLNQPWALPDLAFRKFLLGLKGPTSIGYGAPRLYQKLNIGFNRKEQLLVLSRGLIGHELSDPAAVSSFIQEHYHPLSWYASLDEWWQRLTRRARDGELPPVEDMRFPPFPLFFKASLAAMAITVLFARTFRRFHFTWIMSLGVLWFAVILTGVDNPRYRYVFEPFCVIYLFVGAALLWERAASLFGLARGQTKSTPASTDAPPADGPNTNQGLVIK